MTAKPWIYVWIVLCFVASVGSGVGSIFIIRAGEPLAAAPCIMLCAWFGAWGALEIRKLRAQ